MVKEPNNITSVLLDVNICIDLIVNRSMITQTKKQLFSVFLKNGITVYIPAFSIDTIFYILNSSMKIDKSIAVQAISKMLKYTSLLHSSDESVSLALPCGFSDFEDDMINSLGEVNKVDVIITNNTKDFKKSGLRICGPEEFLALFNS